MSVVFFLAIVLGSPSFGGEYNSFDAGCQEKKEWKNGIISDGNVNIDLNYLPLSGGTITGTVSCSNATAIKSTVDTGRVVFCGGSDWLNGAAIELSGKSRNADNVGGFIVKAQTDSTRVDLVGRPNGTLTWGGKEVERVNAHGGDYIRFESGLQICWEFANSTSANGTTITFPVPFNSTPTVVTTVTGINAIGHFTCRHEADLTGFTFVTINESAIMSTGIGINWIAIGRWK